MDWWWYVVIIAVVVVALALFLRARTSGVSGSDVADPSRDYGEERETNRLGGMSEEDREWEAASLERNRKSREEDQPPPPSG